MERCGMKMIMMWILFLLFPYDGGGRGGLISGVCAEEDRNLIPPVANLDGKEGDTLGELLYKREHAIDEWETEEVPHLRTIKRIFETSYDKLVPSLPDGKSVKDSDGGYLSGPVTLGQLVSSGVGMLVNHRISQMSGMKQTHAVVGNVDLGSEMENAKRAVHLKGSGSKSKNYNDERYHNSGELDTAEGTDDDSSPNSGFALFIIALFPALVGLLILGTFAVLIIVEFARRTRPKLPTYMDHTGRIINGRDIEEGAVFQHREQEPLFTPVKRARYVKITGKRISQQPPRRPIARGRRYKMSVRPR